MVVTLAPSFVGNARIPPEDHIVMASIEAFLFEMCMIRLGESPERRVGRSGCGFADGVDQADF